MLRQNIIANFVGRGWGFVSVYLFVPLYLKFLGIEAYGLVGFYATLLGVLSLADMGFTATLNREIARLSVRRNAADEVRNLLRTYELSYASISILLSLSIWILAPLIAEHWLHSVALQSHEVAAAIRLMGVAIAFQLPAGLYIGGLMGSERQVRANSIQIAWGVLRGVGGVLVLWLFAPTIFAFALWQLISNAAYCTFARFDLWRVLSFDSAGSVPRFKWNVLRDTWHYAAGMVALSVIGMLLTQIDKVVVSKFLSLEMLGYYTIAGTLATVPITVASAIASAVFPQLTVLVALKDRNRIAERYHQSCELIAFAVIPAGLTLILFAGEAIVAWTASPLIAQRAGLVASLLLGGQLLQAMAVIPLNLALAHGNIRLILKIGFASIGLITPLLIYLIMKYGIVGAGASWLILNICTLPINMYFLHRRFLPGEFRRYSLRSVGLPLVAVLLAVMLCRWALPDSSSRLLLSGQLALVWAFAVAASAVTVPRVSIAILESARRALSAAWSKLSPSTYSSGL